MNIESICFEEDEESSSLSFCNLHNKIKQTKNKIEKKSKGPQYCKECKKNFVPNGYKNCIKCYFGNSLRQYLKTK